MPYYPGDSGKEKLYFRAESEGEHYVIDYTGLDLLQIQELDIDIYLYYQRQAYIHYLNQTEDGRKYLENCYYFVQKEPDRATLRKKFGKAAVNGK